MFEAREPAAMICHGPWIAVEADLVRGRTDTEVQVCEAGPNTLITSRKPDDLPAFCATLVKVFDGQGQPA